MDPKDAPKRIHPCNLIDTYVEFKFTTDFNTQLLLKLIHENTEYKLIEIPYGKSIEQYNEKIFLIEDQGVRLFIDEKALCVNIIGDYPGWDKFIKNINALVYPIADKVNFINLRMKYVSKWVNIRIFDHIDGTLKFKRFDELFKQTELSFPAKYNSIINNHNVVARVTLKDSIRENEEEFSLVEIDLSSNVPDDIDSDDSGNSNVMMALKCLNVLHTAEKDMFFRLLSKEFIDTLSPE